MAAIPERADACALSPLQYGMLFHYLERGPHTGCDIQQLDLSLRDETLDVARLVCAWQLVAERHPTLRSCFRWEGLDAPQQDIMAAVDVPVVHHDLSAHTAADRAVAVEQFLTSDRLRGFDLNAAPLWRITLFDLGEAGHRMVWTYSHAILDGCYTEVVRELFDAYDALGDGVAPQFRERPAYRDHIAWLQQDWSSRAASARGFWRERLNLFFKPTTLDAVQGTTGSGRPATGHETLRFRLSPTTTASLRRLGEVHGFPVSAFVQAAWAMVLSAFTGEDDIVFGEIRDCRGSSIADAEAIIGLLINTVPVRARVPRDRPLLALLRDLVDGQAAVRPFEHTPLVEAAGCADVPRGTALFDTAVMVSETGDDIRFKGFRRSAEPGFVLHEQTIFAFTLRAVLEPSIAFTLSFDRARFDSDWARRLAMLLKRLLLAMARRPEMTLGELPRLPARDERALAAFNTTAVQAPAAVCLHEMVEAQVDRTPDAVALTCGSESLTFCELDERANRVAHALVLHGVRPDQTVGIFADHSLDMVVGLLGILKAGGAYIPLDPTYPAERVAMMLEDTQPRVVLTAERLRAHLPPRAAHVTALEAFGRERRPERPRTSVRPDHLAYVMFTSGSTGRPKGVQIEHRNVVSFFGGIDDVLGTTPGVWLALTGISFDISVLELFWTLARGFKVVLQGESVRAAPSGGLQRGFGTFGEFSLQEQVLRHGVTHLQCTPSLLEQFTMDAGGCEALGALRHLLVGGEALSAALVDQLGPYLTGTLHNMYGPTETTIWSTAAVITAGQPITIGRPLANTTIHIRDRACRPVPVGVAGELLIGGRGVTRGYLGQPELTGERFVRDSHTGERLYRTGDLAAWLPDGRLVFLGRIDHQVKIRGHRVEPGEIENIIGEHPSVRECVTVAQHGASGEVRLVAFVVPRSTEDLTPATESLSAGNTPSLTRAGGGLAATLRQYAQTRLPAFMVPSAIVLLSAMPLTPNGKVNRRALASPRTAESAASGPMPENARERAIVGVMQELVGREVGVDDNFFDIGATSLSMIQASWRLGARLGRPVPIIEMLRHTTARALAASLAGADADGLALQHSVDRAQQRQDAMRRRRAGRET